MISQIGRGTAGEKLIFPAEPCHQNKETAVIYFLGSRYQESNQIWGKTYLEKQDKYRTFTNKPSKASVICPSAGGYWKYFSMWKEALGKVLNFTQ